MMMDCNVGHLEGLWSRDDVVGALNSGSKESDDRRSFKRATNTRRVIH